MGITEILRWIWQIRWKALNLLLNNQLNHGRIQLIIAAHNCCTSFCFLLVQNVNFVGVILKILPVTCCVWRFPMVLIPIVQFKWLVFCHIMSNHIPPLPFVLSPSIELGTDRIVRSWVSFSSCQRNLIKTFQIEGIVALITKMALIFSWDLLNGQKQRSKSVKIWFSKSIFNFKNPSNLSKKTFLLKNINFRAHFLFLSILCSIKIEWL